MNYWEHESYGKEKIDKSVTITLDRKPTTDEWENFSDNRPQLDTGFDALHYCDGDFNADGLSDTWERTDTCPRGLVGYTFSGNQINIWASEGASQGLFLATARYTLGETVKSYPFSNAKVTDVKSSGVAMLYSGDTLKNVAMSLKIDLPSSSTPNKPKGPGFP